MTIDDANLADIPAWRMMEMRADGQREIATAIGEFLFAYSRFVTDLHLCVAWQGRGAEARTTKDLGVAALLGAIEDHGRASIAADSTPKEEFERWLGAAHRLRNIRNVLVHSRFGIEAYGRFMELVSTPVRVEPIDSRNFTAGDLRQLCEELPQLSARLAHFRKDLLR
jgi:hypothetical protein